MSIQLRKTVVVAFLVFLLVILSTSSLFAASVGRIKGTVTDESNGAGIPGVSIQIKGTNSGAKTDIDGNFMIISVPPGTYSLVFSNIGYESVEMTGVEVATDQTTERHVQMQPSIFDTKIVKVVTGERQGLDKLQTGTQTIRTQTQILQAPVATVDDIMRMETGVTVDHEGQLHIRGGRAGETNYLVDGVSFSDPLGGRAPVDAGINISSSAVLELKVIKDGFDPEYGEALSGVVTITSPEGNAEKTRGRLLYTTDDFGTGKLNKFSENTDLVEFNIGGPDPLLTSRILPAVGFDYFRDKKFTYFIYSRALKSDTRTPYSKYNSPATDKQYSGFDFLGFHIPDRQDNLYNLDATLAYDMFNNVHVRWLYKGMWRNYTAFLWSHRYTPATAPVVDNNTTSMALQWKHILNKSSDYELNLSYWSSLYVQKPGDPDHPGEGLDPDQFLFTDEYELYDDLNQNFVYDSYEPFINIYPDSVRWGNVYIPHRDSLDVIYGTDDQIGGRYLANFDLNNNGLIDGYEGEPFVDLNGNGIWDKGDRLTRDVNGNRTFDEIYRDVTTPTWTSRAEPYIDGDSSLGEPFTDINRNGIFDQGVDRFVTALNPTVNQDLNRDNLYTGPNPLLWEPGIPFIDYNGNGIFDLPNNRYDPGEPYVDLNKNGRYDQGGDNNTAFLNYGYLASGASNEWVEEKVKRTTLKGNFKKAIGRAHEIKAGFEGRLENVSVSNIQVLQSRDSDSTDTNPYSGRGMVRDFYSRSPDVLVLYFRDKIEYGTLVAMLGLRADLFFQSALKGTPTVQSATGHRVQKLRNKFSPRVSINYPISERAMIRFNYGHFFELPDYSRMYRTANPFERGTISLLGNPNLDYTKTINYTFGVNYAFTDEYALKLSGYYKDYLDIIATSQYEQNGVTLFSYYDNTDYARVRGIEVELERSAARFFNGTLSYEYSFAYGKSSSDAENYQRQVEAREISIDENPLSWDIRHRVSLWLQLYFTDRDHPNLFGISIPNDWDMSIFWRFQTGFPFTPSRDFPNMTLDVGESPQPNSMRLPSTAYTDIKMRKRFQVSGMQYSLELEVRNLFNNENIVNVYSATGRPDTQNSQSQVIFGGTEVDASPRNWGRGRQVTLGIGIQF